MFTSISGVSGSAGAMLFDADIMVWLERGSPKAARAIESEASPGISIITYMELIEGARDSSELRATQRIVKGYRFTLWPLSEQIGQRAATYLAQHRLTHGLDLADALVAATAVENAETLCTANVKHFRAIPDLTIKAFRP